MFTPTIMMRSGLAALAFIAAISPAPALGNPASAYCESRGGKVVMVAGANGGQRALCELPGGTRIDASVYFRNTHRTTH